jgi:CBS domain-containing protein
MNTAAATAFEQKTVGEVMTTDLSTLRLNDTLRLADDLFNLTHLRHFPVLDNDKLVGIINHDDLLHASMASVVRHPNNEIREALAVVALKDIMKPATTVRSDTSIHDAAKTMVENGIECLCVMDGERFVGLVTRTDLLRELACR